MDERSLRVLEFYQFKDLLKEGCISPLGSKRCEALKPSCDLSSIRSRLTEVLELKKVLEIGDDLPLQGLKDIEGVLNRLEIEGSVLGVQELVDIYRQIELCRVLRRFFQRLDPAVAPRLQEKISRLSNLKALEKEILQTISPKGEILDKASQALSDIRGEKHRKSEIEDILGRIRAREPSTSEFCWNCRRPLPPRAKACPYCGEGL